MNYKNVITDANNLYEALLASVENSKWKESSQNAILKALPTLFSLSDRLENKSFKPGDGNTFTLHERGRVRRITSLNVNDRVVRHVLADKIFTPLIRKKIIYDNGASVKGRGLSFSRNRFETHIHRYVAQHGSNKGYILFGDFSKFYDNIDHEKAMDMLLDLVDHDEFMTWLLEVIFEKFEINVAGLSEEEIFDIEHNVFNKLEYVDPENQNGRTVKKSINIGDQLSQLIGIYYPHELDNYVKIVKGERYYGRYMDDWYIISESKEHLYNLLNDIIEKSKELGLYVNHNKTRIVSLDKPFSYLQVRYSVTPSGHVYKRINPKRVTTMRIRLKKLHRKVLDGTVEYEDVENMFKAWMGSFYKIMSKQQREALIALYSELFDVSIQISNGKLLIERNYNECSV